MKKRKAVTPMLSRFVPPIPTVPSAGEIIPDLTVEELKQLSPREQGDYLVQLFIRALNGQRMATEMSN